MKAGREGMGRDPQMVEVLVNHGLQYRQQRF